MIVLQSETGKLPSSKIKVNFSLTQKNLNIYVKCETIQLFYH